MPILHRVGDPHRIYEEAFRHLVANGSAPIIVSSRLKTLNSQYFPVRVVVSALSALLLLGDIYAARVRQKTVFVREFWNIPLLLTAPLLWPISRSVLFNINHNLIGRGEAIPRTIVLLAKMGFKFVLFDGASSTAHFPAAVRKVVHTPCFPSVVEPRRRGARQGPFRIGLVGGFGSDEGETAALCEQLARIAAANDIELYYGQRQNLPDALRRIENIQIVDTRSRQAFRAYLDTLDLAVFAANKQDYFYRHSGTVMDAVASGVVPIVPALPVLMSQVCEPVPVGVHYIGASNLPHAISRAIAGLDTFADNRMIWHRSRDYCEIITEPECRTHSDGAPSG